jgi:hypothetical protein
VSKSAVSADPQKATSVDASANQCRAEGEGTVAVSISAKIAFSDNFRNRIALSWMASTI